MSANLPMIYACPSLLDLLMTQQYYGPLPSPEAMGASHFPLLQIIEDERFLYVRAILPGVTLNTCSLVLDGDILILRGTLPVSPGNPLRMERSSGPFKREIPLPRPVVPNGITAIMRNGLLTVTLPKAPREKRSIPVEGIV